MEEEANEWIPCDVCESMVRFSEYMEHVRQCTLPPPLPLVFRMHPEHFPPLAPEDAQEEPEEQENVPPPEQLHPIHNILPFFVLPPPVAPVPPLHAPVPTPAWVQQIAHAFQPMDPLPEPPLPPPAFHLLENHMNEYEVNTLLAELMGGNVYVGIRDIGSVVHEVASPDLLPTEDTLCAICQEGLREKMEAGHTVCHTPCRHYFCKDCVLQWFGQSKKCPVCMIELED